MLKYFFEQKTQLNNIKQSQSKKFKNDKEIKAIIIKGKAYWVKDNIFYTAETNNNDIMLETAKPINTDNMSEIEINKMLFILDSLKNGGYGNDSGSARN
jgi:argonaute-like protein implicated in RNA metabolism and viral defense